MATQFEEYCCRKMREHGDKFDTSDLDARFIEYFNSDARIKVSAYGRTYFGSVGVTTGWKPVFLLMHNSRCIGSSMLLGPDCEIMAVQHRRGGKYTPAV